MPSAILRLTGTAVLTTTVALAAVLAGAAPALAAPAPISITSSQCPTDIQQGEDDGCVTDLQDILNSKAGAGLTVDGDFGPATLTAVENWQSSHGLTVDGVVGPNTKTSLENAGGGGTTGTGAAAAGRLAAANANKTACGTNSLGTKGFYTSCTGNGGSPEYWCADFAKWAWANSSLNVSGLNAASVSFYTYGQNHGTLHTGSYTPEVGDVIVYGYNGSSASHNGIVTAVNSDGSLVTENGDFGGQSGSEATFASTSKVVTATISAAQRTVGSTPSSIGQKISAYVTPVA